MGHKNLDLDHCKTCGDYLDFTLAHDGRVVRQNGSHIIVKGPRPGIGVIPDHGNQALPTGTRHSIEKMLRMILVLAPVVIVCLIIALH